MPLWSKVLTKQVRAEVRFVPNSANILSFNVFEHACCKASEIYRVVLTLLMCVCWV